MLGRHSPAFLISAGNMALKQSKFSEAVSLYEHPNAKPKELRAFLRFQSDVWC